MALAQMTPRKETHNPPMAGRIVYTDESGKTQIAAAARLAPDTFSSSARTDSLRASKTGHKWRKTFSETCYIYALDVLAALAILLGKSNELRNKSATFYIDNNNAICALIENAANPPEIQATVGAIWHRMRDLRIAPWFDRVPSKRNIDALPLAGRGSLTIPHGQRRIC